MALLFLACGVPLAVMVAHFARESAAAHGALMALAGASERTTSMLKGWLETLSLGLYSGASSEEAIVAGLEAHIATMDRFAVNASVALATVCTLAVLAQGLAWRRGASTRRAFVRQLFAVAALCLGVGLTAPVLSVSAQSDVMLLGTVVLQHDTKDIVGTVHKLWDTGNAGLAALVGLFSIVLPGAKLLLSWLALDVEQPRLRARAVAIVRAIGRWSMTDVFVVALLLAFFAAQAEQLTDAKMGLGLAFFAAYALVSLAGGHMLERGAAADAKRAVG